VFFTSATSGGQKGALFTHRAMIEQGRQIAATNGLMVDDVILVFLPPS